MKTQVNDRPNCPDTIPNNKPKKEKKAAVDSRDVVSVPDHAVQNVIERGKPKNLKRLGAEGFMLDRFLAGVVMHTEPKRAHLPHPPIGRSANERYVFSVLLKAGTYPLHLEHELMLIVDRDKQHGKKWAVVTAMRVDDYYHRVRIRRINDKPGKLPDTAGGFRGAEVLRGLQAKGGE